MPKYDDKVVVIVGQTGIGKTELSLKLAEKYRGEIINCDASQMKKGLDIGTAKVDLSKVNIKHHLIDIIKPDDRFSTHIKMLFSVMFILAFLSPVINGDIPEILQSSISTNSEVSYTGLDKACENEMKRFVEKNIARSLSELMEREGITYDEIFVNVNINEDSSIDISEINIKSDNF